MGLFFLWEVELGKPCLSGSQLDKPECHTNQEEKNKPNFEFLGFVSSFLCHDFFFFFFQSLVLQSFVQMSVQNYSSKNFLVISGFGALNRIIQLMRKVKVQIENRKTGATASILCFLIFFVSANLLKFNGTNLSQKKYTKAIYKFQAFHRIQSLEK